MLYPTVGSRATKPFIMGRGIRVQYDYIVLVVSLKALNSISGSVTWTPSFTAVYKITGTIRVIHSRFGKSWSSPPAAGVAVNIAPSVTTTFKPLFSHGVSLESPIANSAQHVFISFMISRSEMFG